MKSIWQDLLEYARWTPSPHNVQAWKLKIISETEANLYYESKRLLPVTDPTGCFSVMGFAMFIDSLNIAANPKGLKIVPKYLKEDFDFKSPFPVLFANLNLVPTSEKESLDKELIKSRKTSRLPYNNVPVSEELIKKFQAETEKFGHHLLASSDEKMVKWVLDLNRDTLFYDMGDKHARKEIGALLRYTDEEAKKHKDGLWSYCFHIPGWFMKLFFNYEKFFELPIIKQILLAFYESTMKGTRTVAWIQGPFKDFDDFVSAGYAFNRVWLKMAEQNVYLHPFGSVITNPNAHKKLKEKFNADEDKEMMWILMRIGFSEVPPRSLRLESDEIILK